jgi:hypothetical protein
MPAIFGQELSGFESRHRGRVSGMPIGMNDPGRAGWFSRAARALTRKRFAASAPSRDEPGAVTLQGNLWISRSIIEAHGGRLWARPGMPRGAVFAFALPIRAAGEPS